ncbi:MAG: hypothetical protein AAFN77_09480 [Planctomycetota bacterium]
MDDENILIAVALVRRHGPSGTKWLGKLNPATNTIRFPIGFADSKETLRDSVIETVAWELGINPKRDILVSRMAQLNFEFANSVPAVVDQKPFIASFYNVEIYGRSPRESIGCDPQVRWLSSEEIWTGKSRDGELLDPLIFQMVTRTQVIRQWESTA